MVVLYVYPFTVPRARIRRTHGESFGLRNTVRTIVTVLTRVPYIPVCMYTCTTGPGIRTVRKIKDLRRTPGQRQMIYYYVLYARMYLLLSTTMNNCVC